MTHLEVIKVADWLRKNKDTVGNIDECIASIKEELSVKITELALLKIGKELGVNLSTMGFLQPSHPELNGEAKILARSIINLYAKLGEEIPQELKQIIHA